MWGLGLQEDEDKCTFIVLHKTPGVAEGSGSISDELAAMVGDVNLFFNDSDAPHTAEVEIMIAVSECRRLGLGREALLLMLWYGATRLQVTKYTAKIGLANTGSRHLFATLGFEEVSRSEVFQVRFTEKPVRWAVW